MPGRAGLVGTPRPVRPPDRNTRMVIVNAWSAETPASTSPRCTSANSAPPSISCTATTRAASWRRRPCGQPAYEVLGEHREALLSLS